MSRLHRNDPACAGIRRVGSRRGFCFRHADGSGVTDPDVPARIRALAVPPAWTDGWISTSADGHIQATGVNAAGRTPVPLPRPLASPDEPAQVRAGAGSGGGAARRARTCEPCHPHPRSDQEAGPGRRVPAPRSRRCKHVRIHGDAVEFDFPAKGNLLRAITVQEADVARALRPLIGRPGEAPADMASGWPHGTTYAARTSTPTSAMSRPGVRPRTAVPGGRPRWQQLQSR